MKPRVTGSNSGMTLLELLVALGIFAITGAALYPVLIGAISSRRDATERVDVWSSARAVLDRVELDLRGSTDVGIPSQFLPRFLALAPATRGFGEDREVLEMTTLVARGVTSGDTVVAAIEGVAAPLDRGDQAHVRWSIDRDGRLLRQEVKPPRAEQVDWSKVRADVLAVDADLRFEFYETASEAWIDAWNSTEPGPRRDLAPVVVRLTLSLEDGEREPLVLVSTVVLPTVEDPWARGAGGSRRRGR